MIFIEHNSRKIGFGLGIIGPPTWHNIIEHFSSVIHQGLVLNRGAYVCAHVCPTKHINVCWNITTARNNLGEG